MNALQQLIQDYLDEHPGETYVSIAARASLPDDPMPWQTVQALHKRARAKQTPRPATLRRLARGLGVSEDRIKAAAASTAGYGGPSADRPDLELLMATVAELDPERLDAVARRARSLHEEMVQEQQRKKRKGR